MVPVIAPVGRRLGAVLLVRRRFFFVVVGVVGLMAGRASAEPLKIMPLGDSITSGYTNGEWTGTASFTFGYRGPLYTRLTKAGHQVQFVGASAEPWKSPSVGDETGPNPPKKVRGPDLRTLHQDHHRGYWGQTTKFIAGHVAEWLKADNPDIVLLAIGINNDDMRDTSTEEPTASEDELKALVQTIVDTKPDAKVIVAQVSPYTTPADAVVKYNNYIKNTLVPHFQEQGKHVTTVDQYANFLSAGGAIDKTLYANGSGVHPNVAGYARIAQTWFAGIQAVVAGKSGP
jgi:acyl-CoA thioesterase I